MNKSEMNKSEMNKCDTFDFKKAVEDAVGHEVSPETVEFIAKWFTENAGRLVEEMIRQELATLTVIIDDHH